MELNAQSVGDFALKELLTHGTTQHFRRTMLGVLAQAFQQLSGIKCAVHLAWLLGLLADSPAQSHYLLPYQRSGRQHGPRW